MRVHLALTTLTALALAVAAACGGSSTTGARGDGSGGGGTTGPNNGTTSNPATSTTGIQITTGSGVGGGCMGDECQQAPPNCGDANLTADEACDDGNTQSGDGCSANCLVVEEGYSCNPPGQPCRFLAVCGDGFRSPSEGCDDGNVANGDGCNERCKLEDNYKCDDGIPNICTPTVCGDGIKEGSESCDDGNSLPYDGCSANCRAEPNCVGEACVSSCGDGLLLGEECDDGNLIDGDGCSSTCTKEEGFMCDQQVSETTDLVNGINVLRVPVIFRDFMSSHPDFSIPKTTCDGFKSGMVGATLDLTTGTPTFVANNCLTTADNFKQWYTDVPGTNATIPGELVLFDNGLGGFVNRYGENGEQWAGPTTATTVYCNGEIEGAYENLCGTGCTLDEHEICYDTAGCTPDGNTTDACKVIPANVRLDGTPLFFPLDGNPDALMDTLLPAKIPEQYGYNGWPWEQGFAPGEDPAPANSPTHNFYFTTEARYWFQYNAAAAPTFKFTGDDDVWVFVNNKLVLDLGGIHVPLSGAFTLDATLAGTLGLVDGNVYEIAVFQAERRPEGSSFRLTLEGFSTARTECVPICGDGIVSAGEACDDGVNDGGYGECAPGCVIGPYCGDGVVDPEHEDCDDGNRRDGDECGSACRDLEIPK